MDNSNFRPRAQVALDSERMQLLTILARYWEELEHNDSNIGNPKPKWDLWDIIGQEFNALPSVSVTRTPLQIKTLFKNMKTKAKKYKLRMESSKACGVVVESDPVSEIVLQLTNAENKDSLKSLLDSLQTISFIDQQSTQNESTDQVILADSSDPEIEIKYECVPEIEEEVVEAFENPCVIKEDDESEVEGNVDGSVNGAELEQARSPVAGDPEDLPAANFEQTTENVDTSECGDGQFEQTLTSPPNCPSNVPSEPFPNAAPSLKSPLNVAGNFNQPLFQPNPLLNLPMSIGLLQLSSLLQNNIVANSLPTSDSSGPASTAQQRPANNDSKECVSTRLHEEMFSLAQKEHELNVTLLNEELLDKQLQRKMFEDQIKRKEQALRLRQDQRRAQAAEHEARMKLLDTEFKSLENRLAQKQMFNFSVRNGSKEV